MSWNINKSQLTTRLDLNEVSPFLSGCQVVSFSKITKQTLFLMDLSNIAPKYQHKTLVINYLNVPLIVSRSVGEMIKELNQGLLIDSAQQKKVLAEKFGQHYRLPILSGYGIFVPFNHRSQNQWYNLLFIERLIKASDETCLAENCRVMFSGGCEIIFPKAYRSFLSSLQKDLCQSYYFSNYLSELALRQAGCKKSYSQKIKQLLIRFNVSIPQDMTDEQLRKVHLFLARCQVETYLASQTSWELSEIEALLQIS